MKFLTHSFVQANLFVALTAAALLTLTGAAHARGYYGVSRTAVVHGPNGGTAVAHSSAGVATGGYGGAAYGRSGTAVAVGPNGGVAVAHGSSVGAVGGLPRGYYGALPVGYTVAYVGGSRYYYAGGVYYQPQFYNGATVYVQVN